MYDAFIKLINRGLINYHNNGHFSSLDWPSAQTTPTPPPSSHMISPASHMISSASYMAPSTNHMTPPAGYISSASSDSYMTPSSGHMTPPADHITSPGSHMTPPGHVTPNILHFSYTELSSVTGDFTDDIVGMGAFGTVFRAKIRGNGPYAVKKLHNVSVWSV